MCLQGNGDGKTSVHRPEVTPTVRPPVQSSEPDDDGPAADTDAENPEEATAQVWGYLLRRRLYLTEPFCTAGEPCLDPRFIKQRTDSAEKKDHGKDYG
jgi:hypothetical protein